MKKVVLFLVVCLLSGCGTTFGSAKDPWFKIPDGMKVSFGVTNIDHVIDREGLNVEHVDNRRIEKF